MKTSPAGIAEIKRSEGVRLTAYRDSVGVLTIGYGHTSAAGDPRVTDGMRITDAEAESILRADLAIFEKGVLAAVKVPLTQGQFDALVSFSFNLGLGNLAKSTLLRKLNAGDYAGAANEFGRWNRAGGRVLRGLTDRRAREAAIFRSAERAAPPPPDIEPATEIEPAAEIPAWFQPAFIATARSLGLLPKEN